MEVLVTDLIKSCEYKLDYFHKILRHNGIENRIILDEDDLIKLRTGVKVVGKHSYSLRIYIDNVIRENILKASS